MTLSRQTCHLQTWIQIELVGDSPMVTRASAVACAVDERVYPVPVPTSWRRPWIPPSRWSLACSKGPRRRSPDWSRIQSSHPPRCPRRRCTVKEFVARDSLRSVRNTPTEARPQNLVTAWRNSVHRLRFVAPNFPHRLSKMRNSHVGMKWHVDEGIICRQNTQL